MTLLEKLVAMHREAVVTTTPSPPSSSTEKRGISYRQLCSSLIFARRHVYPPEQPVFPHNYTSEAEAGRGKGRGYSRRVASGQTPTLPADPLHEVQVSSCGSLMEANLKASRLVNKIRFKFNNAGNTFKFEKQKLLGLFLLVHVCQTMASSFHEISIADYILI